MIMERFEPLFASIYISFAKLWYLPRKKIVPIFTFKRHNNYQIIWNCFLSIFFVVLWAHWTFTSVDSGFVLPTPRYRELIFCTHNIELLIHRVLRCLTVKEHRLWERVYIVYITLSFGYIGKYWYAVTLLYIIQCTVYTKYIVYCAVWWWKSIDRTSGLDGWHWPAHCDCKVYIKQPLLQKENQENNFQAILNIEVLRPQGGFEIGPWPLYKKEHVSWWHFVLQEIFIWMYQKLLATGH